VKLTRAEPDGGQAIVGLRQQGHILGAVSLSLGAPYSVTAETITKSKLCYVATETFWELMKTNSDFSRWVTTILSRMLKSSLLSITETSCLTGRQRLERFLWKLIQAQAGSDHLRSARLHMVLKNWEVAQLLALTPQYVCRLVKKMEREGVVRRNNGWLIIDEPNRLSHPEMTSRNFS